MWVVEAIPLQPDGSSGFNQGVQGPGDQVDPLTQTQSTRYPVWDFVVSSFGAYGNNQALRIWAPTTKSVQPIDPSLLGQGIYPIRMACYARPNASTTPTAVQTMDARQYVDCCLVPGTIDLNTDAEMYAGDVFLQAYTNITDPTLPPLYGPFGQMAIYDEEIELLVDMFYSAEKPFINAFSDFTGHGNEQYLFNMLSGVSSANVPYTSYQIVTGVANSARLTDNTNLFAVGGSDGTMNETLFADLVTNELVEYANPNSVLQDIARYPESIFYDSGFPIATKQAIVNFIALRKDTAIVLATHDVLQPQLNSSQESALATALLTFCQMYPESDTFGTGVVRALIMGRSGTLLNSQYKKPLPLSIELASKAANYMGAGTGSWKTVNNFDQAPGSQITMFTNVNVTFTPDTVRNKDWANGLNWVDSFSRRSLYFPALKTVVGNDTSVLTSFFTMLGCVELEKVGERARRQFSGTSSLTPGQLVSGVNKFIIDNTTGRFGGRFTIIPAAYISAQDDKRGYSWTCPIKIYAANMKTVATLSIESYRIEDLPK